MAMLVPVTAGKLTEFFTQKQGFSGPYQVEQYRFVVKDNLRLRLPDIAADELIKLDMLRRILTMAGIRLD